eukprot:Blabericola_migrator_1__3865@NODE_2166_length_3176_cov_31_717594_g1367_i0_p2_GENE_NODE_2166_length_3176_cov_31_717594_g1367_i0NODE_2166_length_3176_cov_31_717594_g1367_i0_p2_ORF_typecomplete_len380_score64_34_NODE_2166_length_3176_cov_31_717594_g1367_i018222961
MEGFLRRLPPCVITGFVLLFLFMVVINPTLILDLTLSEDIATFTRFGLLYSNAINSSLIYIDYEWLVVDTSAEMDNAMVPDAEVTTTTTRAAEVGNVFEVVPGDDEASSVSQHPFLHHFPFYAWYGNKPDYSLGSRVNRSARIVHLLHASTLSTKLSIHYLCYNESAHDWVVFYSDNLWPLAGSANQDATLSHLQVTQTPIWADGSTEPEVTFVSFVTTEPHQDKAQIVHIGILRATDVEVPCTCQTCTPSPAYTFFELITSVLSSCLNATWFNVMPIPAIERTNISAGDYTLNLVSQCNRELILWTMTSQSNQDTPDNPHSTITNKAAGKTGDNLFLQIWFDENGRYGPRSLTRDGMEQSEPLCPSLLSDSGLQSLAR